MNEKFNKNAKVEKLTKKVGRGVRLIVIGPFEHVTLTVTFDLNLKNFVVSHNFLILRDKAFIFGKCVPFDKAFLMITSFERVTLIVTFDLLLNIGHDFLTVRDWVFKFSICVPYVHTFPIIL